MGEPQDPSQEQSADAEQPATEDPAPPESAQQPAGEATAEDTSTIPPDVIFHG